MKVIPSPDLRPDEYLPGIGPNGAEVPDEKAKALIAAGLVVPADKPKKAAAPADEKE